jgi:hypothetical protein
VTSAPVLALLAIALAVVIVVAVVLVLRGRSRAAAVSAPPAAPGPKSPTTMVCPFCKVEYDPAETGGHCPGCGAAAPRRRS